MKKLRMWMPIVLPVLFLLALIIFRKDMMTFISESRIRQLAVTEKNALADSITAKYNYVENGASYEYTFLEFGAKGCTACKQMEGVMEEIKSTYPAQVNVVFVNLAQKGNDGLSQYFGIATIPTQVLLDRNGKEYFRHSGYISAEELKHRFTFSR